MNPRRPRKTEPQDTRLGLLVEYAQIGPHLIEGELRGREWIFARAQQPGEPFLTDGDILDLHAAAFAHLYDWAGTPRKTDIGPGGIVYVPHFEVRIRLRELQHGFRAWYDALPGA